MFQGMLVLGENQGVFKGLSGCPRRPQGASEAFKRVPEVFRGVQEGLTGFQGVPQTISEGIY